MHRYHIFLLTKDDQASCMLVLQNFLCILQKYTVTRYSKIRFINQEIKRGIGIYAYCFNSQTLVTVLKIVVNITTYLHTVNPGRTLTRMCQDLLFKVLILKFK